MTGAETTFTAPGKGEWRSLRDHFPRAVTPEFARLLSTGMREGEAVVMEQYGFPVRSIMVGLVHGHVYIAPEPLVGRPSDTVPPRAVLWAASRLLPVLRRRHKAAATALATRPWLVEAERWFRHERSTWVAANRIVQDVDPEALDDAGLVAHLHQARAHADLAYHRHFSLHGPDLVPTGMLLARGLDWGIPPDEVLAVLTGSSPASTGQDPLFDVLRAAVAASGTVPGSMAALRSVAGTELDAVLEEHGWRLITGYDLDSLSLGELPSLLVQLAQPGREDPGDAAQRGDAALVRLLDAVPPLHHDELRSLVSDARATAGVRDDNSAVTVAWPAGLLRRAMLAAGRRLHERGALEKAEHAIEVTVDELTDLLRGSRPLTAPEIAARAEDRVVRSALVAPLQLGPTQDIPLGALPARMQTIARSLMVLRDVATASLGARASLEGDGIGTAVYRGRACVATDPGDAFDRMAPGDVLVALGTAPAYNLALSIAGALVVEEGGLVSHAAVMARELGLPTVVGAGGAMAQIPDGASVEVDPVAGRVRVLSTP